uniref:Putative secreted protein n=1 Tax=Anopheles darlingi TaxID=43151 RepID=A0A2M4DR08_ANODA
MLSLCHLLPVFAVPHFRCCSALFQSKQPSQHPATDRCGVFCRSFRYKAPSDASRWPLYPEHLCRAYQGKGHWRWVEYACRISFHFGPYRDRREYLQQPSSYPSTG